MKTNYNEVKNFYAKLAEKKEKIKAKKEEVAAAKEALTEKQRELKKLVGSPIGDAYDATRVESKYQGEVLHALKMVIMEQGGAYAVELAADKAAEGDTKPAAKLCKALSEEIDPDALQDAKRNHRGLFKDKATVAEALQALKTYTPDKLDTASALASSDGKLRQGTFYGILSTVDKLDRALQEK